jgi:hypothetical protein
MDVSKIDKFHLKKTFSELEKIKQQFIVKNGANFERILYHIPNPRKAIRVYFLPWYTAKCYEAGYDIPLPKKYAITLVHRVVKRYQCSMASIQKVARFFLKHFEFFKEWFWKDRELPNIEFFASKLVFQRLQFYNEADIIQTGFMEWLAEEIKKDRFREFMFENYGIEVDIHAEIHHGVGELNIPTYRLIYMREREKRLGIKPKKHSFFGQKFEWGYQF